MKHSRHDINAVKLSAIVATFARTSELRTLFDSLIAQTLRPCEVIVVDQNEDNRLAPIIHEFNGELRIVHLHIKKQVSLSRARNIGIDHAAGQYCIFPDDDCWYPNSLFERMMAVIEAKKVDIVSGRCANDAGEDVNGNFSSEAKFVSHSSVWDTQIEWMVVAARSCLAALDGYDVDIGVGGKYGSCEGQDLSLRAIKKGYRQFYDPTLTGRHLPVMRTGNLALDRKKAYNYGVGMGYVLRIHGYSRLTFFRAILRPSVKAILLAMMFQIERSKISASVVSGRWKGFHFE